MRNLIAGAVVAMTLGLGLAATTNVAPASAQGIVITPQGVRIYPGDPRYSSYNPRWRRNVDRRDAIYIAQRNGVGRVRNVNRSRGDWLVVGDARRGPGRLRVRINDRTGRVLSVTRVAR